MELSRPEVTVTDPRHPGVLVRVEEPPPPTIGRRGAALLAAAALVGALALVAADVVRDRRLAGVVDLAMGAPGGGWSATHDPGTGTGTVAGTVRLLNAGPRDVRITAAELGGLRYEADGVVEAGDLGAVLELRRAVRCPGDGSPPPSEREPRELRLHVETAAGPRTTTLEGIGLPIGSVNDSVQTACAYPPLRQAVDYVSTVERLEGLTAVLRVAVANDGREPVRLLSLIPARGLQVVSVDGDRDQLPVLLPPQTGRSPVVRSLEVRLVVLCSALLGADLLTPFEELSAIVEADDRSAITSIERLSRDPELLLRQLAGRTCSSS